MKDFIITLSDEKPPVPNGYTLARKIYRECGRYDGTPKASEFVTITCGDEGHGQYLFYYVKATNYIHMCEMEVYGLPTDPAPPPEVNIALKKPNAYMSGNGKATPANDGNINPVWGGQSCIQTNYAVSIAPNRPKN